MVGAVAALLVALGSGLAQVRAVLDAPGLVPGTPGAPAAAVSLPQVVASHPYLPLVVKLRAGCEPIPGVEYSTLDVDGPATGRPAEEHADLNLALRGYRATKAYRGVGNCDGGGDDPKAPQLHTLFADRRTPAFTRVYHVYDWNWGCNCRGNLLTDPHVTLAGWRAAPGEILYLPDSGYDVGGRYEALVLYASEERITLKYTLDDDVVIGYTIHVEDVCVEPSLLALYRAWDKAGRGELPALRGGQPFGRALGTEIRLAIRDNGRFLDPRSRRDWW